MTYWFYLRISTNKQKFDCQEHIIKEYCKENNIVYDENYVFKDFAISGAKDWKKRAIMNILEKAKEGDTIISSERSRLARDFEQSQEIDKICIMKQIKIKTILDEKVMDRFLPQFISIYKQYFDDIEKEIKEKEIEDEKEKKKKEKLIYYCESCNKNISTRNKSKHNKTEKHILKNAQKMCKNNI